MARKQPSSKATIVALTLWGAVCFTLASILIPIVGETVVAVLGLGAFFLLIFLIEMCRKFFDGDEETDNQETSDSLKSESYKAQDDLYGINRFEETEEGLRFLFKDGNYSTGWVDRTVGNEPIFHSGVDYFNYAGAEYDAPKDFLIGEEYIGLVMEIHDEDTFTLLAHRQDDQQLVTTKVSASPIEDFTLSLEKLDVVTWRCLMPSPSTIFGGVTGKAPLGFGTVQLGTDNPLYDYEWRFKG